MARTKKIKESLMDKEELTFPDLDFLDLEDRFGQDNAKAILRTLEQFEGITDTGSIGLSFQDRLRNVMSAMRDNIRYQTRH